MRPSTKPVSLRPWRNAAMRRAAVPLLLAVCAPAPVTRLSGPASRTCFAGPHSSWSPPLAPPAPQRVARLWIAPQQSATLCSSASQLLWRSPTSRARASSATAPRLPDADRRTHDNTHCRRSDPRYPRFRRNLFARDVALDPGGTTMPRITALHMLRSTVKTVSAPASSSFRGSLPHPTQPLCTLRVRRHRRLTQHSLPGGSLGLTWAGLAPADRASFAWRLPSFDDLVSAGEQGGRHVDAERPGGAEIDHQLELGLQLDG